MADFIVPDCQIRKVNGRIYGAGSRIPGYSEAPESPQEPAEAPKVPEPVQEPLKSADEPVEAPVRRKKKKRGLREEAITVEDILNTEEDQDE